MPHIPLNPDWKKWEIPNPDFTVFECARLHRETWFDDGINIYHATLWEDTDTDKDDEIVAILVDRVEKYEDNIWAPCVSIAQSLVSQTWPELDRLFGSRQTWTALLDDFRKSIYVE